MEHRCNTRIATNIKVALYHHRIPAMITRASNLSAGGIFIDSKAMIYPRNTLLEVELTLPTDKEPKQFTVRTCVVYGSDSGMGLVFLDSDSQLTQAIKHMTRKNDRPSAPLANPQPRPVSANVQADFMNYKICAA